MKIQYASDLHLEFRENSRYLKDFPLKVAGDILVLAGDSAYLGDQNMTSHPFWDWASENYEQVIVALGNHEFYKYYDLQLMTDGTVGKIRKNVHYYYNRVIEIGDVAIVVSTLWAHIPLNEAYLTERFVADFHRILYGENMLTAADFNREHEHCLSFIKKSVAEQKAAGKKVVVVTHHVPSFELSSSDFAGSTINGAFTVELKDYIAESGIDYWIYGHSHRNITKRIGNTECLCNQLGYTFKNEHSTFQPDKFIEL